MQNSKQWESSMQCLYSYCGRIAARSIEEDVQGGGAEGGFERSPQWIWPGDQIWASTNSSLFRGRRSTHGSMSAWSACTTTHSTASPTRNRISCTLDLRPQCHPCGPEYGLQFGDLQSARVVPGRGLLIILPPGFRRHAHSCGARRVLSIDQRGRGPLL